MVAVCEIEHDFAIGDAPLAAILVVGGSVLNVPSAANTRISAQFPPEIFQGAEVSRVLAAAICSSVSGAAGSSELIFRPGAEPDCSTAVRASAWALNAWVPFGLRGSVMTSLWLSGNVRTMVPPEIFQCPVSPALAGVVKVPFLLKMRTVSQPPEFLVNFHGPEQSVSLVSVSSANRADVKHAVRMVAMRRRRVGFFMGREEFAG